MSKVWQPRTPEDDALIEAAIAPYLALAKQQGAEAYPRFRAVYNHRGDGVPRVTVQLDLYVPVKAEGEERKNGKRADAGPDRRDRV